MVKNAKFVLFFVFVFLVSSINAQIGEGRTTPMMGWASWNNFRIHINEQLIKQEADALVSTGLKDAGYTFINIDDGYLAGRDKNGNLLTDKKKFPRGMKWLADYIHNKGLKAGIYTDAGINTCASVWDRDTLNHASGMYGHDKADLTLFLKTWGYDFLKVDWCGGKNLGLDEQIRYTQIANLMKEINPDAILNICRWQFPGKWAPLLAGSWRISGDIANNFKSILHIIDLNADLWKYASSGHFNDMDMLQVGRGMTYEEDKSHFSMWCILNSPLMLGNDLRTISKQTLSIVTNKELIALNQDPFCYQARRLLVKDSVQIWAKPLKHAGSGEVAVALLNTKNTPSAITFNVKEIGINPNDAFTVRDLWKHKTLTNSADFLKQINIPAHGTVVLRITGRALPFNKFENK